MPPSFGRGVLCFSYSFGLCRTARTSVLPRRAIGSSPVTNATPPLHSRRIHCLGNSSQFTFTRHRISSFSCGRVCSTSNWMASGYEPRPATSYACRVGFRMDTSTNRTSPLALFWVSPAGKLKALFEKADGLGDPVEVVTLSARHDVHFLPPAAND
jgi:hypothetical protein